MKDGAIPIGSFISSVGEWHYFAGGVALGWTVGLTIGTVLACL